MHFLISPAKSLDFDSPYRGPEPSLPQFLDHSQQLISVLRQQSAADVGRLMDISGRLAELNVQRYADWSPHFTDANSKPAALAFNGDVYDGLDAASLSHSDLEWAQSHVSILSGLYGVLRPLDRMQPYRLEMGTALQTDAGRNLYEFWGDTLAEYLNQQLAADASPVIVNLASQEYFQAADRKRLKPRVIACVFEDWKGGKFKIISFFAKRARGLMLRHAIQQRCATPAALESFHAQGYRFDAEASEPDRMVFRRRVEDPA